MRNRKRGVLVLLLVCVVACSPGRRSDGSSDAPPSGTDGPRGLDATPVDAAAKLLVYAHTASSLFSVDPDTLAITSIGDFLWPASVTFDSMTDIAIDKTGAMIGISFTRVYKIDPATAQVTLLSAALSGTFNGLSFVPASMIGETGDDVLIATRNNDGVVFRIDPMSGDAMPVGNMGSFSSSGDLVAVSGFGTVQTVPGGTSDVLVQLAPGSFSATPIGTGTGFTTIWGIAHGPDKIFGFTSIGQFILIDPVTGVGTLQNTSTNLWWGAAVNTTAQIVIP